eukprot:426941_1
MANGDTIGCSVYKDRLTVVPKTAINHDGTSGKGGEQTLATYCPVVPQLQAANKEIESQNRPKKAMEKATKSDQKRPQCTSQTKATIIPKKRQNQTSKGTEATKEPKMICI